MGALEIDVSIALIASSAYSSSLYISILDQLRLALLNDKVCWNLANRRLARPQIALALTVRFSVFLTRVTVPPESPTALK